MASAAAKAALVEQVKAIQRSGGEAKQAWGDYCDTHLGGFRDPNRHDATVLAEFVAAYSSGQLLSTQKPAPPRPATTVGVLPNSGAATDWAALGAQAAASLYGSYASAAAAVGSPAAASLASAGAASTAGRLQEFVKTGQRQSIGWKTAWQSFCTLYGNGFSDPAKVEESFIKSFMDYAAGLASADLANLAAEQGITLDASGLAAGAAPGKRPLGESSLPPAKRHAVGAGPSPTPAQVSASAVSDPEKAHLVEKVKMLQRSNADAKDAWTSYCEEHSRGIRDPARHEKDILQQFLATYG